MIDINCLRRHNVEVIIYYGIYWDKSIDTLFDSYFKPLVEEKKQQDEWKNNGDDRYKASIRNVSKLLMNALSGKLIERVHNVIRELCRNANDIDRFFSKTIKGSQKLVPYYNAYIGEGNIDGVAKMPSIIGVLIYAYAREHMYENVISRVERLYGTDTDSAFITRQDFENNIDKKIVGNDFGQFKIEEKDVDGAIQRS
ncbi:hypothetical protein G6F27_013710 [Rhizopus arrhizus]|nr:hypothetical protein G6F27_013710 [Rhizopus arrhizus]